MSAAERFRFEASGECASGVHFRDLDFVVGPDNPFIRLRRYVEERRRSPIARPSDLDFVEMLSFGLVGKLHFVDVTAEDPEKFRFRLVGRDQRVAGDTDLSGRMVGDIQSKAVGDLVRSSYAGVKQTGRPLLSWVAVERSAYASAYRRFLLPLADDGCEVSEIACGVVLEGDQVGR